MRYIVDTEHIRGERRLYWVVDTLNRELRGRGSKQVTEHTTDKRKAERWCGELNCVLQQQGKDT